MPLYIDHHKNLEGLTAEAVAEDHKKDLEVQDKHGAKALSTTTAFHPLRVRCCRL